MSEKEQSLNDINISNINIKNHNHESEDYDLFKFNVGKKTKSLNIKESKKNVICFGGTGSGKTTNLILPSIDTLIEKNCCGLILDVKADLFKGVYDIAQSHNREDDLLLIGLDDICAEINLFASLRNHEQLKNVLMATLGGSNGDNSYWLESGMQDFINVSKLYQWVEENIYKNKFVFNVKTCFHLINNKDFVFALYKKLEEYEDDFSDDMEFIYQATLQDPFSIYNSIVIDGNDDASSQKEWRSGQITKMLQKFIEEPIYSKMFNSNSSKSIYDLIFKEGKVLVLVIPIEYESIGFLLGRLVRELYFKAILVNGKKERNELKIGEEFNRYSFLVIDEYQGYINTKGANGVITDEFWTSISRSFENINLFATQSLSSLLSAAGNENDVNTLMQNCVNEILLTTKDIKTVDHISFVYQELFNNNTFKIQNFINPSERFGLFRISGKNGSIDIYKGDFNFKNKLRFHDYRYLDVIEGNYQKLLLNFQNKEKLKDKKDTFIERDIDNTFLLTNKKKVPKNKILESSICKNLKNTLLNYGIDLEIIIKFLLTPYTISLNYDDTNYYIYQNVKHLSLLKKEFNDNDVITTLITRENKECKENNIAFIGKKTYETYNDINDKFTIEKNELYENYKNVKDKKIIFIFMGGGDLSSVQFKRHKNPRMIQNLRKNNESAIIITAIGHSKNIFFSDLISDRVFNTPSNLGEYLERMLYKAKKNT
jgi:hypothetical protein